MYRLILCPYTNLEVIGAIGRALSVHSLVWPNRVILILGGTQLESRQKLDLLVNGTTVLKRFGLTWSKHLDMATQPTTQLHLMLQRFFVAEGNRIGSNFLLHSRFVVSHWNGIQLMLWNMRLPHAWTKTLLKSS